MGDSGILTASGKMTALLLKTSSCGFLPLEMESSWWSKSGTGATEVRRAEHRQSGTGSYKLKEMAHSTTKVFTNVGLRGQRRCFGGCIWFWLGGVISGGMKTPGKHPCTGLAAPRKTNLANVDT